MSTFIQQDQPDEWTAQLFAEIENWFREHNQSDVDSEDAGEVASATRHFGHGDPGEAVKTA